MGMKVFSEIKFYDRRICFHFMYEMAGTSSLLYELL